MADPGMMLEVNDDDLRGAVAYVLRQNRSLLTQGGKRPEWHQDHRPEMLAKLVVEHLRLCGIRTQRLKPMAGHSTP